MSIYLHSRLQCILPSRYFFHQLDKQNPVFHLLCREFRSWEKRNLNVGFLIVANTEDTFCKTRHGSLGIAWKMFDFHEAHWQLELKEWQKPKSRSWKDLGGNLFFKYLMKRNLNINISYWLLLLGIWTL